MLKRIPCVGFELNYSPFDRDCVENLLNLFGPQKTNLSFDVHQKVEPGQQLVIMFSNQYGPTEKLYGRILSCHKLDEWTYRINTELSNTNGQNDKLDSISMPLCKGVATPAEIALECPACSTKTTFSLIANQKGEWSKGIMPLYNCNSCGTTRAMIGLLEYNKK